MPELNTRSLLIGYLLLCTVALGWAQCDALSREAPSFLCGPRFVKTPPSLPASDDSTLPHPRCPCSSGKDAAATLCSQLCGPEPSSTCLLLTAPDSALGAVWAAHLTWMLRSQSVCLCSCSSLSSRKRFPHWPQICMRLWVTFICFSRYQRLLKTRGHFWHGCCCFSSSFTLAPSPSAAWDAGTAPEALGLFPPLRTASSGSAVALRRVFCPRDRVDIRLCGGGSTWLP